MTDCAVVGIIPLQTVSHRQWPGMAMIDVNEGGFKAG